MANNDHNHNSKTSDCEMYVLLSVHMREIKTIHKVLLWFSRKKENEVYETTTQLKKNVCGKFSAYPLSFPLLKNKIVCEKSYAQPLPPSLFAFNYFLFHQYE